MRKVILVLVLGLSINVVAQDSPNWAELQKKFYEEFQTVSPEQQLEMVESFLRKYPQMPQAERILSAGIHVCLNSLKNPEKGENLIQEFLESDGRTENQILFAKLELAKVYGVSQKADELLKLITELTQKELDVRYYGTIAQAALDAELWDISLEWNEKAESHLTLEEFKKRYGGREDFAKMLFARRSSEILTRKAAALIGKGKAEKALEIIEKAEKHDPVSFIGRTNADHQFYKAKAYKALNNLQKAADTLAPSAVFLRNEKHENALKAIYLQQGNPESGFANYLENKRVEFAPIAPDFTLNTFDGEPVSLSSFKGKVVFLNFWSYG